MSDRRITVWRCENSDGYGPYNDTWPYRDIMSSHHDDEYHPSWWEDSLELGDDYIAGCPTRKLLISWFDGFHKELYTHGFLIKTFRIPEERVFMGDSGLQVVFEQGGVSGTVQPWRI